MKKHTKNPKFSWKKNAVNLLIIAFSTLGLVYFSLPGTAKAALGLSSRFAAPKVTAVQLQLEAMQNEITPYGTLPEAGLTAPRDSVQVPVTAYSSDVWQTDSTPFTTASGTRVRDGVVAANFLPIGTRVRFPEIYGDKIFVVEDRMNARYNKHADIWMSSYDEAVDFGIKYTTVEVF